MSRGLGRSRSTSAPAAAAPLDLESAMQSVLNEMHDTLEFSWNRCNCLEDTTADTRSIILETLASWNNSNLADPDFLKLRKEITDVLEPIEGDLYSVARRLAGIADLLKELDQKVQKANPVELIDEPTPIPAAAARAAAPQPEEEFEDEGIQLPFGVLPCASTRPNKR